MTDLLFAWHLHVNVGLSGSATSLLMTALLLIGASANFTFGHWLTIAGTGGSGYVRVQFVGAVLVAILLAAQFLVRDTVVIILVAVSFRIAFALQDVSQSALGLLLPSNEEVAASYARLRVLFSGITRIVAIGIHMVLTSADMPLLELSAFILIGGCLIASAWNLFGVDFPDRVIPDVERRRPPGWPDGLPTLLAAFAISSALLSLFSRLLIFTPASGPFGDHIGSWLLGAFYCGVVAGPSVQHRLIAMFPERAIWRGTIGLVLSTAVFIPFGGWPVVTMIAAALHGIGMSMIGAQLWTAAARIAMADARSGNRRDGLVAGAVILTTHLSMAVCSLLLGPLIEAYEAGDVRAAIGALLLVAGGGAVIAPLAFTRRTAPATA